MFTKKINTRVTDFDCFDRINPSALLGYFQDVATEHAEELGVGYEQMKNNARAWILLRVKYEQSLPIGFLEELTFTTYPLTPNRVDYDREYNVYNGKGELVVKGSSKWCVIDFEKRQILIDAVKYNGDVVYGQPNFSPLKKLKDFPSDGYSCFSKKVEFTDLDHNIHVNNAKYADFALNAVCKDTVNKNITGMEIDYISEIKPDDEVGIYYAKDGSKLYVIGKVGEKESFKLTAEVKDEFTGN